MKKKTSKKTYFTVLMWHEAGSDTQVKTRESYDEAVEAAHKFFLSYGFQVKDGVPYDADNDDGKDGGKTVFDNVKMHNGKVAGFMHFGGEGPICSIVEN